MIMYPPPAWPTPKPNRLATLSIVFSVLFAPAGAVLGHLGLRQIRRTGQPGRQRAVIGLTISYLVIAGLVVALVLMLIVRENPAPTAGTQHSGTEDTAAPSGEPITLLTDDPVCAPGRIDELRKPFEEAGKIGMAINATPADLTENVALRTAARSLDSQIAQSPNQYMRDLLAQPGQLADWLADLMASEGWAARTHLLQPAMLYPFFTVDDICGAAVIAEVEKFSSTLPPVTDVPTPSPGLAFADGQPSCPRWEALSDDTRTTFNTHSFTAAKFDGWAEEMLSIARDTDNPTERSLAAHTAQYNRLAALGTSARDHGQPSPALFVVLDFTAMMGPVCLALRAQ